jgi:hypothetical protein
MADAGAPETGDLAAVRKMAASWRRRLRQAERPTPDGAALISRPSTRPVRAFALASQAYKA